MKRLVLAAVVLALSPAAQAQSMNVRGITETVTRDICGPFIRSGDMWAAIGAAQAAGYGVAHISPGAIQPGPTDPVDVELQGSHAGVVRMLDRNGLRVCSVGIHEGSVATIAEIAGPWLGALGMTPELDQRDGPLAISIWRGDDLRAVISRSTEFRPGSELVITAVVQVD